MLRYHKKLPCFEAELKCLHRPVIVGSGTRSKPGALLGTFCLFDGKQRLGQEPAGAKLGKVRHKKRHPCHPDVTSAWQLAFVIVRRNCN